MEEKFEQIQEYLTSQVCNNIETANLIELGEVIDMMKDMSEVMYYHAVTEAMLKHDTCADSCGDSVGV